MCGKYKKSGRGVQMVDWTGLLKWTTGMACYNLSFYFSCLVVVSFHARMEQNGLYWNGQQKKNSVSWPPYPPPLLEWPATVFFFHVLAACTQITVNSMDKWISVGYIRSWICNSDYVVGAAWSDVQWNNGDTLGVVVLIQTVLLGRHVHMA